MGYRGKVELQEKARVMRAEGRTLLDIATELGVAKSSVSLWVRDVPFEPAPRQVSADRRRPHPQHLAKVAEIARLRRQGRRSDRHRSPSRRFSRRVPPSTPVKVRSATGRFASQTLMPRWLHSSAAWLRRYFTIDESRLRVRVVPARGSRSRRQPSGSGRGSLEFPVAVQSAVPGEGGCVDSHEQTRTRLRLRRLSLLPHPQGDHWAGPGAANPRVPFRGSSIGRANDC